jgi:transcriptional regulator with XRE-family HTH domain
MQIARRIRKLCQESPLSPAAITLLAELEPEFLLRLEAEQEVPTPEVLERLASALGVPVSRFFVDIGQPPVTPKLTPRPLMEGRGIWNTLPSPSRTFQIETFLTLMRALLVLAGSKLRLKAGERGRLPR